MLGVGVGLPPGAREESRGDGGSRLGADDEVHGHRVLGVPLDQFPHVAVAFSYSDVVSAAGVGDPREIHTQLASGSPGSIREMAAGFARAASSAREATAMAGGADDLTAAAYSVDGRGVHDSPAPTAATRVALGDGGAHSERTATSLKGIADHLEEATGLSAARLGAMDSELSSVQSASQRLAAFAPGMTAAAALAAEQALFDRAVDAVRSHGSQIRNIVDGYDDALAGATAALADHQPLPPDDPRRRAYRDGEPQPTDPQTPDPQQPGMLDEVGQFLGDLGGRIGAFGESALHNPGAVAAGVLGAGLVAVSLAGEAVGIALDVTGVGALVGVPAGALATAGVVTGAGIIGTAIAKIDADSDGSSSSTDTSSGQGGSTAAEEATPGAKPGWQSRRADNGQGEVYQRPGAPNNADPQGW